MEWVETTAKSVDEAKELALDKLGVDAQEAEFEVLEEPKAGLFGRIRGEARVRARVAPRVPRPKQERRDRRKSSDRSKRGGTKAAPKQPEDEAKADVDAATSAAASGGSGRQSQRKRQKSASNEGGGAGTSKQSKTPSKQNARSRAGKEEAAVTVTLVEQTDMAVEFLTGLMDRFGFEVELATNNIDDDTNEIDVRGNDLGVLIGPRGQTISALQELTRTVLQKRAGGSYEGRVRVDVSGYRQRRRDALVRFTTQIAEQVRETGSKKALEPMNASDRKVVHDTVNEIDGVRTSSEGEEPRRWVVIHPE